MILSLLNNIKYYKTIKLMNCDIIDENKKLEKIDIKDIENMVQKKCENLNNTSDNIDIDYTTNNIECEQLNYELNYLKKDLIHIMNYYGLSVRKKKKSEIIEDIINFESNKDNQFIVNHRKTLWYYWEELLNDEYLSKFVINP